MTPMTLKEIEQLEEEILEYNATKFAIPIIFSEAIKRLILTAKLGIEWRAIGQAIKDAGRVSLQK